MGILSKNYHQDFRERELQIDISPEQELVK